MIYYLDNFKNLKIFYIFNLILAAYALYLTNIIIYYKLIIFLISCIYIYSKYHKQCFIHGFYLNGNLSKAYLITLTMQKIRVNFVKIEYCSSWLIILIFANKFRKFRILVFKNQLKQLDFFKNLIVLGNYKFLPSQ